MIQKINITKFQPDVIICFLTFDLEIKISTTRCMEELHADCIHELKTYQLDSGAKKYFTPCSLACLTS
jgi:hypothetical protein